MHHYLSFVVLKDETFSYYQSLCPSEFIYICVLRNLSLKAFFPIPLCNWLIYTKSIGMLLTHTRILTTVLLLTLKPSLPFHFCPPHKFRKGPVNIATVAFITFSFSSSFLSSFYSTHATETPLWISSVPYRFGSCSSKPPGPTHTCLRTLPAVPLGSSVS